MKCDTQHNGTYYTFLLSGVSFMLSIPNKPIMLILNLLSVAYAECHRQTHYMSVLMCQTNPLC